MEKNFWNLWSLLKVVIRNRVKKRRSINNVLPIFLDMQKSLSVQKPTVNADDLKKLDDFREDFGQDG